MVSGHMSASKLSQVFPHQFPIRPPMLGRPLSPIRDKAGDKGYCGAPGTQSPPCGRSPWLCWGLLARTPCSQEHCCLFSGRIEFAPKAECCVRSIKSWGKGWHSCVLRKLWRKGGSEQSGEFDPWPAPRPVPSEPLRPGPSPSRGEQRRWASHRHAQAWPVLGAELQISNGVESARAPGNKFKGTAGNSAPQICH